MNNQFEREYAYRSFGALIALSFCLLIIAMIYIAAVKSETYALAIFPGLLLLILSRWSLWVVLGKKILFSVSADGIAYGGHLYPWSKIKRVYASGGTNIKLQEEYIPCIEFLDPTVKRTQKFPISKRFSKEEWNEITDWIKQAIVPSHQHVEPIER